MLLIETSGYAIIIAVVVGLFGFALWFLRSVMLAFRSGTIAYSGNRPTSTTRSYSRREAPGMFWTGIVIHVVSALLFLGFCGLAIVIMVTAT